MPINDDVMVWLDLETTGLDAGNHHILEIGVALTDPDGGVIDFFSELVLDCNVQTLQILADEPALEMHRASGLWADLEYLEMNEPSPFVNFYAKNVQQLVIDYLERKGIGPGQAEMCGATVAFDRRFLQVHMPRLEQYFHYRNVDVSSLITLCRKLNPAVFDKFEKTEGEHRVMSCINAAIENFVFMKDNFLHTTR